MSDSSGGPCFRSSAHKLLRPSALRVFSLRKAALTSEDIIGAVDLVGALQGAIDLHHYVEMQNRFVCSNYDDDDDDDDDDDGICARLLDAD